MALTTGTRLGPYEIVAAVGAGGMGEVYRARDTRLGRDVAIKVLPQEIAGDADRLRRFEQEARAAAALNHPGILALHDVGVEGGISFIVTELLEGRSLGQVLRNERLPVSRVVELAVQVADGLAAAHALNIVHRDVKPDNLFITSEGRTKILDFGLAKSIADPADPSAGDAPTRTSTEPNTVFGTAGYMAPEQACGRPVDHRADIFAFGAVVYEMLAGRRAFAGDTVLETMTAVLHQAPAPIATSADRPVPAALVRIVERCLEKTPSARFQSTTDLAFALRSVSQTESIGTSVPATTAVAATWRRRLGLTWVAAGLLALSTLLIWRPWRGAPTDAPLVTFTVSPPAGFEFGPRSSEVAPFPRIAPDGKTLAFVAFRASDPAHLWLRRLDSLSLLPLDGNIAPGASGGPFWSPDGQSIASFSSTRKLQRFDIQGQALRTICELPAGEGRTGAWAPDGTIIVSGSGALMRVASTGGTPADLTKLDTARREVRHQHPVMLPDGRHFLYLSMPGPVVWVGSLDGGPAKRMPVTPDSRVEFGGGYLVYVRETRLFAQPFDAARLDVTGDAVAIADDIRTNRGTGNAAFSLSASGVLVYRTTGDMSRTLAWYDRSNHLLKAVKDSPAIYSFPALVPGERSVMVDIRDESARTTDVWKVDLDLGTKIRITSDPGGDGRSVVSPDGAWVAWSSARVATAPVFKKRSNGTGTDELWLKTGAWTYPTHWSANHVVFTANPRETRADIWVADRADVADAHPYLKTEFAEHSGRLSPDERWMAYVSDEADSPGVYIRPFPDANAGKWRVPGPESGKPSWRSDGRELFYVTDNGDFVAVPVTPTGASITFGPPQVLFHIANVTGAHVAIAADGQRFLVAVPPARTEETPLTVVTNWTKLLGRK